MPDKIRIIQDISLLYELSLSVGSSLDPEENCHNFLRTLISRKSLNFGAIWLHRTAADGRMHYELFSIYPHFREAQASIPSDHFIAQELETKPFFSLSSQDAHFEELLHEKKIGEGSYAVFRMGELGFLKLFATNRSDGFPEIEMAQLKQVVDKLTISLDGCFAHIQLKKETENRLVAQKALEDSRYKLRRIIDTTLDAVVSANIKGVAVEWNAQAEKMFGYTRQEVLGKPLREMFIPERHWQMFEEAFREYLRTTDETFMNKRYEIKCIRKDGTEFPAELSITADKADKNTLFVGFVRDITEQRKAQLEIEQAQMRMGNLIANLQSGILLEDKDNKVALVNKAFCDIFSIPVAPETLIGMDCGLAVEQSKYLFQHPEAFVKSIQHAEHQKKLMTNEVLAMTNGKILERDYIPLFSGDKHEGHLWQYTDVTERQNTQQTIRDSEEKYRGVLENMELGLLEVDLEDTIIRANNAFCQMLGYNLNELIGHKAGERFLPETSRKIIQERLEERKMGQSSVYELQMQRKNGDLIWGLISGAPIKNAQGQIVGSIGIQFDLTERKKLETELAEAKLVADRARMAERQFLTHMSHEIRTPINAVIGMTHLLDETNPNPTQQDYLNNLRFSADSLLGIIDNILDLSKIDAGEIDFEQKSFDLDYLLQSLMQSLQFKIEEKEIQISKTSDPAIQNLVVGDPTRINQILTNLLGNALKFTEKGVVRISTKLLERSKGHYLIEFRVQDTGIGIPADKTETIFEYFKQADVQINRKFGGTGLGLTIVKQLVEMQGGAIQVESTLGLGSEFIITLPFGDSGIPVADLALLPEKNRQATDSQISGSHLLIVEDNLLNQKLFCKTLESWKCTYEVANNGLEALAKTMEQRFDAILMDIHMPQLDGCETTLAIRNDPNNPNKDVPIIALTAAAMPEERRRAFEVGMNDFLTKPIAPKTLQEYLLRSIYQVSSVATLEVVEKPLEGGDGEQIDLTYLLELSHGDLHFVQNILEAFQAETPVLLQSLKASVEQHAWDQVGKIAHKLKPNFAMLGMKQLHAQLLLVEACLQIMPVDREKLASLTETFMAHAAGVLPLLALPKGLELSS